VRRDGDLNGDGDTFDSVWHVYDAQEGTTTNLAMAAGSACSDSFLPPPLLLCDPSTVPVVEKKISAVLVGEKEQGATDLNGDTDAADQVLHLFEIETGHPLNIGLADATVPGPSGSPTGTRNPLPLETSGQKVMMTVGEAEQGGIDLNQDGDADDQVAAVINAQNGRVRRAK